MRSSVQLRPIGIPRICVLALLLVFVSSAAHAHAQHIGVLFGSFGDVESCQCVNSYFKGALERLVGYEIPVRDEIERKVVADLVWSVSKKETFEMSEAAGPLPQCDCQYCFYHLNTAALAGTRLFLRSATHLSYPAPPRRARLWCSSCEQWACAPPRTPPTTLSRGPAAPLA